MPIPRRKIEELIAKYELHPNFRDVFVEGARDRGVFEWFLGQSPDSGAAVYDISTVEVPAGRVLEFGLEDSNRGRVISLAYLLENSLGPKTTAATCIADSDFEPIVKRLRDCGVLLLTDYTCIEMYAFNEQAVGKFLKIIIGGFPKPAATVLSEISGVLRELFLVRLANHVLGLGLKKISPKSHWKITRKGVNFDADAYLREYLDKNGKLDDLVRFKGTIESYRSLLPSDPRASAQGHDFELLLLDYLRRNGVKKSVPADFLCRALMQSAESTQLAQEPLFSRLLQRLRS